MPDIELKKLIKNNFAPILREFGFKGSGFSFRRVTNNHYIYVITVQANRQGGSYCIEMGVYIDFIPNSLGQKNLPSRVTAYDCEFNKRLSPKGIDYWWKYGKSEQDSINDIKHMVKTFREVGIPFFEQFEDFPAPLDSIIVEDIVNESPRLEEIGAPLDLRLALTLARVHKYLNISTEGIKFCDWGLNNINCTTGLITVFEEIRKELICCSSI
ncbi:DUF4304 domain-containing protein [Clostridium estertheticum]|uniref:DUF4304 domain-containing protein n=1 Tax=Clostridium estertheticum TaxID=238834 RepID=UPI0013E8FD8B|nr:DUF4304 domain-containing protein [Clostridium estertheticum]MBZ9685918.1 DUF4304 domain-containing protein [Clostridium estertheticum]